MFRIMSTICRILTPIPKLKDTITESLLITELNLLDAHLDLEETTARVEKLTLRVNRLRDQLANITEPKQLR